MDGVLFNCIFRFSLIILNVFSANDKLLAMKSNCYGEAFCMGPYAIDT